MCPTRPSFAVFGSSPGIVDRGRGSGRRRTVGKALKGSHPCATGQVLSVEVCLPDPIPRQWTSSAPGGRERAPPRRLDAPAQVREVGGALLFVRLPGVVMETAWDARKRDRHGLVEGSSPSKGMTRRASRDVREPPRFARRRASLGPWGPERAGARGRGPRAEPPIRLSPRSGWSEAGSMATREPMRGGEWPRSENPCVGARPRPTGGIERPRQPPSLRSPRARRNAGADRGTRATPRDAGRGPLRLEEFI